MTERGVRSDEAVIIGAGASGLFCAVQAAWQGHSVTLIEKEKRCGRKLLITGKGRCNVTNNCDAQTVMKNIPRNPRFMYSALSGFSPEDTMAFFESLGVPLKTERGNRVFPESDKAQSICGALVDAAKQAGVRFVNDKAVSLDITDGAVSGVICERAAYRADKVVVATGGCSYPLTGSTGDGYIFAGQAGHSVTEISPSLCPIVVREKDECAAMTGISLRNCTLSLYENGRDKPIFSQLGELLFTHFGLSGPLVLSASAHMDGVEEGRYRIAIDLKPGLDSVKLDDRLVRDFREFPNRELATALKRLLPAAMGEVIAHRAEIEPFRRVNEINREERRRLGAVLKGLDYNVRSLRPIEEAIITRGGVDVKEVSPKTMESKLVRGLYFIGEVLDVDGYTGGFNLQIAFSTAYACAGAL